jgi:hypothetical protein
MKTCSNPKCVQINPQPLINFYKKKHTSQGLNARCIKCTNRQTDAWVARNLERVRAIKRKWSENNREKHRENNRIWYRNNPDKKNAQVRKYQASKLKRTPSWLTYEQNKENETFYIEAAKITKLTGIPHEVDHIEPLQGKNVSGLHVPWNLQILPRLSNRQKNNKRKI